MSGDCSNQTISISTKKKLNLQYGKLDLACISYFLKIQLLVMGKINEYLKDICIENNFLKKICEIKKNY